MTFIAGASKHGKPMGKTTVKCALCGSDVVFKYRPMQEWNISGMLCGQCYEKRLTEHYIAPDRRGITKR